MEAVSGILEHGIDIGIRREEDLFEDFRNKTSVSFKYIIKSILQCDRMQKRNKEGKLDASFEDGIHKNHVEGGLTGCNLRNGIERREVNEKNAKTR